MNVYVLLKDGKVLGVYMTEDIALDMVHRMIKLGEIESSETKSNEYEVVETMLRNFSDV